MSTATVRACGVLPPAGEAVSQGLSDTAVKLNVPVPVFVTFTLLDAGLLPPWFAEKDRLVGVTDKVVGFNEYISKAL